MTSLDFDASLKQAFLVLHVFFLAGAAAYLWMELYNYATFFGLSSIAALLYYEMFQNKAIMNRLQAHLNLIEQAITESEEFRQGVKKKSEASKEAETTNLKDVLAEKKTDEAEKYIEKRLQDKDYGDYGNARGFLEAVKEAEEEGLNRLGVRNFATEKILEEVEKRKDEDL